MTVLSMGKMCEMRHGPKREAAIGTLLWNFRGSKLMISQLTFELCVKFLNKRFCSLLKVVIEVEFRKHILESFSNFKKVFVLIVERNQQESLKTRQIIAFRITNSKNLCLPLFPFRLQPSKLSKIMSRFSRLWLAGEFSYRTKNGKCMTSVDNLWRESIDL